MYHHADSDPLVGTLFADRYLINFLVARGGMGNIYQAHDVRRGHIVALKMLRAEFSNDPIILRRFERESESVKQLKHPHICQLFDTGCTPDGIHYFTMEFLEGHALDSILAQKHVLPPMVAVRYTTQVAAALCDAHNHNIIHRDLKPANIFIVETNNAPDFVKVLDFGVAKVDDEALAVQEKLTNAGSTLGTPFYMSPEQIQGLNVDGRTDVYALGIILWECLFGNPPFTGKSLMEIFKATMSQKLPKLPVELRGDKYWKKLYDVLKKALEKDRNRRYKSMQEFLRALEKLDEKCGKKMGIHDSTPREIPAMKFLTAIQRISPLRVAIFAAIVILCVGAVVGGVVLRGAENHEIVQTQFKTYRFYADVPSKILINGETVHGMTPQSLDLDLDPPFTVVFMTDDAPDYSFKVQDDPDVEITSFAVNMKPKNVDDPMLELETVPRDATVFINGQRQFDETPCKIPIDVDDPFQIVIQKKGYKTEKIFVASHGDHVKILSNLLKKDDKNLDDKSL